MTRKPMFAVESISTGRGRGGVALHPILPYTRVLESSAFARVSVTACDWCLRTSTRDVILRKCGSCRRLRFCSRQCQQNAWRGGHKLECAAWKEIPMASGKSVSQTVLLVFRLACKLFFTSNSNSTEMQGVLQLQHHYGEHAETKIGQFEEMSALVIQLITRSEYNHVKASFEELLKRRKDDVVLLFCRVNCNAFTIANDVNAPVAIGLFPDAAMLNHSCYPNCIVSFRNDKMFIRAIRHVEIGEELTVSYTELLESTPKRQQALQSSYFFTCECSRCSTQLATSTDRPTEDDYLDGYKCLNPSCDENGVLSATCPFQCLRCGFRASDESILQATKEFSSLLSQIPSLPTAQHQWTAYKKCWLISSKLHHRRNATQASLARDLGNFLIDHMDVKGKEQEPPVYYLRAELSATEWVVPKLALPSRGLLYMQIGKLLYESGMDACTSSDKRSALLESREHLRHSLTVFGRAYESDTSITQTARTMLDDVERMLLTL